MLQIDGQWEIRRLTQIELREMEQGDPVREWEAKEDTCL